MARKNGLGVDIALRWQSLKPQEIGQSTQNSYPVVEMFHSVQGEGYWAGNSAFFIRLAGCDVGCPWCDTKESWLTKGYPALNVAAIVAEVQGSGALIAIVTGGEPLIHDCRALVNGLQGIKIKVHLETSGTYPLRGDWDWITLSPKPHRPPYENVLQNCDELKVIVQGQSDIDWAMTLDTPAPHRYLQPEWSNQGAALPLIMAHVLKDPQWRVSLQTHKFMGIQ